ncbi:hypothetical protein [Halomonas sp. E19]|uniref:hypothetical protein n=1 Tax=Halomonas sp. E19 TaxID=3397247 RepID=UPI004033D8C9
MPNYVAINLNVTCKNAEQLNTFLEAIQQDPVPEGHERAVLCFNRIIPMPECLRDTVEGASPALDTMLGTVIPQASALTSG